MYWVSNKTFMEKYEELSNANQDCQLELFLKPNAHSRFLSLRHAILVFSLKNLLCAVT